MNDPRWDKLLQLTCSLANYCTELTDPIKPLKEHRRTLREYAREIEKDHAALRDIVHGKSKETTTE